jgi:hypothetical protein
MKNMNEVQKETPQTRLTIAMLRDKFQAEQCKT